MGLGEELAQLRYGGDLADALANIGKSLRERKQYQDVQEMTRQAAGIDINTPEGIQQYRRSMLGLSQEGEAGQSAMNALKEGIVTPMELQDRMERRRREQFQSDMEPYLTAYKQYEQDRRSAVDEEDLQRQELQLKAMSESLKVKYPKEYQSGAVPSVPPAKPIKEAISLADIPRLPARAAAEVVTRKLRLAGINMTVTASDIIESQTGKFGRYHVNATFTTGKDGQLYVVTSRIPTSGEEANPEITATPVMLTNPDGSERPLVKDTKGQITFTNYVQLAKQYQEQLNNLDFQAMPPGETPETWAVKKQQLREDLQLNYDIVQHLMTSQLASGENNIDEVFKYLTNRFYQEDVAAHKGQAGYEPDINAVQKKADDLIKKWGMIPK